MRRSAVLAGMVLSVAGLSAEAGPCDAYFPFDGNLLDAGGNGYHGLPIVKDGQAGKPQFAAGKIGQALHVTGDNAVRAFVDLHPEFCPQVTVTAWFRLESLEAPGNQYVFSTGAGGGPGIYAQGPMLAMNGEGNGIYQSDAIRDPNTWFFVAAVYDFTNMTYTLHWRSRTVEGTFGQDIRSPEDSFWVGTYNDTLSYTAQNLYVDDLRIHGRAFSAADVQTLAADLSGAGAQSAAQSAAAAPTAVDALPACASHADCAAGTYCAWDDICHPERHAPKRILELSTVDVPVGTPMLPEGTSSGGSTLEEFRAAMAERNASRTQGITYESPADLLQRAASSDSETEPAPATEEPARERRVIGWTVSSSDVRITPISGYGGDIVLPTEVSGRVMTGIEIFEPNNVPCDISLVANEESSGAFIDRCTPSIWMQWDASVWNKAVITPAAVTSLRVCDSWQENDRVKGILVSGNDMNDDGSKGFYRQAQGDGPNCEDWLGIVACDTGYVSTGVVAHFKDRDLSDALTGVQLICRKVVKIYD